MSTTQRSAAATQLDPQAQITALRARLLGGRGAGAPQTELEAHKRQRVVIGGSPVTMVREQVALEAQRAGGNEIDPARQHAFARLDEQGRTEPDQAGHQHRSPGSTPSARLLDTAAAMTVGMLLGGIATRWRMRRRVCRR